MLNYVKEKASNTGEWIAIITFFSFVILFFSAVYIGLVELP